MTSPTGPVHPAAPRTPSYTMGLLLNIFLSGSGFTYIGRWGWHLIWAVAPALLFLAAVSLNLPIPFSLMLLLALVGLGVMLAQYHAVYQQQAAHQFRPRSAAA